MSGQPHGGNGIATHIEPWGLREELQRGFIPFGDWLPDVAPLGNPGCLDARNGVPLTNSFGELKSLTSFTNALDGKVLAHKHGQSRNAVYHNIAATKTTLYRLTNSATTWVSVNPVGTTYAASGGWEFVLWGDHMVAVSREHAPQTLNLQSSTTKFGDLDGDPPRARRAAAVRNWLVLGDIQNHPSLVRWSAYDDITKWEASQATQAGQQELPSHLGRVQKITPGEFSLILCEHGIVLMTLNAGDVALGAFQFDEIEQAAGTPAPNSVCWSENRIFFYTHSGFHVFSGGQMLPIGANKVDRWFRSTAKASAVTGMQGVVDRVNRLVIWGFESRNAPEGVFDTLLMYNWAADRWGYAQLQSGEMGSLDVELLTEYVPSNQTIEEVAMVYTNLDQAGIPSFDSSVWLGGTISLAAFTSDHKTAVFAGDALPAVFETTEFASDRHRLICTGIRPVVEQLDHDNNEIRACVHWRNSVTQVACVPSPPVPLNASGVCPVRVNSRYQRYRVYVDNGFQHAHGVIPRVKLVGAR